MFLNPSLAWICPDLPYSFSDCPPHIWALPSWHGWGQLTSYFDILAINVQLTYVLCFMFYKYDWIINRILKLKSFSLALERDFVLWFDNAASSWPSVGDGDILHYGGEVRVDGLCGHPCTISSFSFFFFNFLSSSYSFAIPFLPCFSQSPSLSQFSFHA